LIQSVTNGTSRPVLEGSFGDIFFNNCFRNGLVPVRLPGEAVESLAALAQANRDDPQRRTLVVSLEDCTVRAAATGQVHAFDVPARLRRMLLEGLDEIALTRTQQAAIDAYRVRDRQRRPWAYR